MVRTCPLSRVVGPLPNGPIGLTDEGLLTTETTWEPILQVLPFSAKMSTWATWLTPPTLSIQETQDPNRWFPHDWREHALDLLSHDADGKSVKNVKKCVPKWWEFHGDEFHFVRSKKSHQKKQITLRTILVSTPLKNISQNGNLPQVGVKIINIWNHHLVSHLGTFWVVPLPNFLDHL